METNNNMLLQEISKTTLAAPRNLEASVKWNNQTLVINVKTSIYILKVNINFTCFDKRIDVSTALIDCPRVSHVTKLFDNLISKNPKCFDRAEMQLDPALWPHNPNLLKEMGCFTSCEWSPPSLLYNGQSVIAALTNFGHIALFGFENRHWTCVFDLSSSIDQANNFENLASLETVREAAKVLETCAFCWGQDFKQIPNTFYFVTAQRNGDLLFWVLRCRVDMIEQQLLLKCHIDGPEITSTFWHKQSDDKFLLLYSNILGELYSMDCAIKDGQITVNETVCLWQHKDRMVIKNLEFINVDSELVFVFVKNRNIVFMVYDEQKNDVAYQCTSNINEEKVSSLHKHENTLYVGTVHVNIYKIFITLENRQLDVKLESVPMKETYPQQFYGIAISDNNMLWALIIEKKFNSKDFNSTRMMFEVLFHYDKNKWTDDGDEEIKTLMSNPTEKLTGYCDCLALLRHKVIKRNSIPNIDYIKLLAESDANMYKLKLYLVLLCYYDTVKLNMLEENKLIELPETSIEKIKELILTKQAQDLVGNIFQSYQQNSKLTELEEDSLIFVKDYLRYFCKKHGWEINALVNMDVFNLLKTPNKQFVCMCCDHVYDGSWYGSDHFIIFCSKTFTPIYDEEYLICPNCNVMARFELCEDNPLCTFCDSHMSRG